MSHYSNLDTREIALRWMPRNHTNEKSTLIQVVAWGCHATSHYLNQCWPRCVTTYGVTRWLNISASCTRVNGFNTHSLFITAINFFFIFFFIFHYLSIYPLIYFAGLGWGMVIATSFCAMYYNVIIAWVLYYLGMSFCKKLPWADCNHIWNTDHCLNRGDTEPNKTSVDGNTFVTPEEEFWE